MSNSRGLDQLGSISSWNDEISWASFFMRSFSVDSALAGIVGTFLFGIFMTIFGCKRAMLLLSLPCLAFWLLVYFGNTYYHILIGRFFQGITGGNSKNNHSIQWGYFWLNQIRFFFFFIVGGIQSSIVLYVSEIADNKWAITNDLFTSD